MPLRRRQRGNCPIFARGLCQLSPGTVPIFVSAKMGLSPSRSLSRRATKMRPSPSPCKRKSDSPFTLCHGLGQSARNHVEDHLSLPAACSLPYASTRSLPYTPPPSPGDCPNFRGHRGAAVVGENGTVPLAPPPINGDEVFAVCDEVKIPSFFISNIKGYEKNEKNPQSGKKKTTLKATPAAQRDSPLRRHRNTP